MKMAGKSLYVLVRHRSCQKPTSRLQGCWLAIGTEVVPRPVQLCVKHAHQEKQDARPRDDVPRQKFMPLGGLRTSLFGGLSSSVFLCLSAGLVLLVYSCKKELASRRVTETALRLTLSIPLKQTQHHGCCALRYHLPGCCGCLVYVASADD